MLSKSTQPPLLRPQKLPTCLEGGHEPDPALWVLLHSLHTSVPCALTCSVPACQLTTLGPWSDRCPKDTKDLVGGVVLSPMTQAQLVGQSGVWAKGQHVLQLRVRGRCLGMRTPLPHPTGGVRLKPNDVRKLHRLGRQHPGSTDGNLREPSVGRLLGSAVLQSFFFFGKEVVIF